MAEYGFFIPSAGRTLIAGLLAGETLEISRVMVGSGKPQSQEDLASLTDLVAPVAQATSTNPLRKGDSVEMVVEYRSDLNGGLSTGFWLNEFGIFAMDGDDEVMIYYGCLGDFPQWDERLQRRRHRHPPLPRVYQREHRRPGHHHLPGAGLYDGGRRGAVLHDHHPASVPGGGAGAHRRARRRRRCPPGPSTPRWTAWDARLTLLELMYSTDVSGNPFTITFQNLDGVTVEGVHNAAQGRIEF